MLRDEIAAAIRECDAGSHLCLKDSSDIADAALAVFKEWLGSAKVIEAVAEQQANGWGYGTHPKNKACIVLAEISSLLERE